MSTVPKIVVGSLNNSSTLAKIVELSTDPGRRIIMINGKIQLEGGVVNQSRTIFKPGSWLAKIDFINHLILFNNVLITVLSEKEGGKTSFGTLLQNNLDQQIKSISMTATPPCNTQHIIDDISAQLHLINGPDTNIASIVTQINERKSHVLFVIDDAQHLPESLIKEFMLAIKNQTNFGFFHLCLLSDYSIVATLNNLAVDQFNNLVHTIEPGALNENETRTYLLQKAMSARLINKPLTEVQSKKFFQLTRGNLAKINLELESFVFKCSNQKKSSNMQVIKKTGMTVAALVVAGFSYMYRESISTALNIPHPVAQEASERLVERPQRHGDMLVSQIPSWLDSSTRQFVHFALPKKLDLDELADDQTVNTVAIVDKVVVIPTVKAALNFRTQDHQPQPETIAQTPVSESILVRIADFGTKEPVVKKLVVGQYTIQLAASHDIADVKHMKETNKLFSEAKLREFSNEKGKWYILTIGEFENRNSAQQKVKNLPTGVAKLSPWVRPIAGLADVG